MKSKTWLILLTIMMVILLAYSGKVTNSSFNDAVSSTDNILRVKDAPLFGAADNFAVLAYSTITNDGNSIITGDIGVSPMTSLVGFPPGVVVNGTTHVADAAAANAQLDLITAYTDAAGRTPFTTVTGDTLAGLNLPPGVYRGGALSLTGTLILTGNATDVWIFQAASTLDISAGSHIVLGGTAKAANVYWVVGSSATLGANSSFEGNIMAYASITLYSGAWVEGRVLARTAAVTLNGNIITKPSP
jgi:Ice-binding-like